MLSGRLTTPFNGKDVSNNVGSLVTVFPTEERAQPAHLSSRDLSVLSRRLLYIFHVQKREIG